MLDSLLLATGVQLQGFVPLVRQISEFNQDFGKESIFDLFSRMSTRKSQSIDWLFSFQAYLKLALMETGNGKRRGEAGGFSLGFYRFVIQTCSKDAPLRTSMT